MKKWISVCGYDFSCEKVLYNEFEPLIFICIDQHGQRYLTFTEDDTEFLFVSIGLGDICDLVNDRITIAACAKRQKRSMLLDYIDGEYVMKEIPMSELDDELLPDPREFMEASDDVRRYYNNICSLPRPARPCYDKRMIASRRRPKLIFLGGRAYNLPKIQRGKRATRQLPRDLFIRRR